MGGGRAPCCDKTKVRTGPWSPAEDLRLMNFIQTHGHSNWRALPKQAGLMRCGKSCRLRWINYLRPDVKRGNFTAEEENTIIQLHSSIGNKWSKIASCLPGRTDNEIKNVWNTHLKKRAVKKKSEDENMKESTTTTDPDPDPDPAPEAETESSPSSSSLSSSSSSSCCVSKEAVVPDFDVDFWEVLDSLDPLEEAARGDDAEEVEIGKWLRMLENELGLDAHADADRLPEPQLVMDFSATHHYLGI